MVITRYRRFARAKARSYFLVGGDGDDVEQEALIGLYKAARDFRPEHQVVVPCLRRAVHHPPDHHGDQDGHPSEAPAPQPVRVHLGQPLGRRRRRALRGGASTRHRRGATPPTGWWPPSASVRCRIVWPDLSDLEVDVLTLYVEGQSYQEIGDQLGRHVKSIDNALQRIKRKLEVHLGEHADADHDEDLALIA